MLNKSISLGFALAAAFSFSQAPVAAEQTAADSATVVVYRADESVKTKRLKLDVSANAHEIGSLSADGAVLATGAAGEYTLNTSIAGSEPLTLELKPGATYYVHTRLKMRGSRIYVSMEQVTEQVAKLQRPALDNAI